MNEKALLYPFHPITIVSGLYFPTTFLLFLSLILFWLLPMNSFAKTLYTTDGVNVRSEPDSSSSISTTVSAGTPVTKTGKSGNWIAVSVDGFTGYIYKDYLSSSANVNSASSGNSEKSSSGSGCTYVNSSDVNLRKKANSHCKVKAVLSSGENVTILSTEGNWTRVQTQNGIQGYVYSIYLGKKSESSKAANETKPSRSDMIAKYRSKAISYAETRLGDTYSQSMRDSDGYADCSSLVRDAFENASGTFIGDTTVTQSDTMETYLYAIDKITDVTPGDLVYHLSGDNHTGIYLGNGKVLHASQSSGYVKISTYDTSGDYWEYGCNAAAFCYDN